MSSCSTLGDHSMIIVDDGIVFSWGYNIHGQLGNATTTNSATPQAICNLENIISISCGSNHSMALSYDNKVFSWGSNLDGQLGNGTTTNSLLPLEITCLTNLTIILICCGSDHSMALSDCGGVFAWGNNKYGQLGNGTTTNNLIPQEITYLRNITSVACGECNSMALDNVGKLFSWGYNSYGQFGTSSYIPAQIDNLTNVISMSCGFNHSMALNDNGEVFAWGFNNYGQLGDGTKIKSSTPHRITSLSNICSISCGVYHSMALTNDGQLYSWGNNEYGQLGIGNVSANSSTPQHITNLRKIVSISCGGFHSMAITSDDKLLSWGDNVYGQLGHKGELFIPQELNLDRRKYLRWVSEIRPIMWEFQRIIWKGRYS